MKFLVDAHIGWMIIRFLESRGHDVARVATLPPKTSDEQILRQASTERRIVITSDKDFGELVFRLGIDSSGVILLRIDVATEVERLNVIQHYWDIIEKNAERHFLTVSSHRVRRKPLRPH